MPSVIISVSVAFIGIRLITGASHTGKTNLAQKMLEKYHYPYVSQDHIKMGLIRSGNTTLTPDDDYCTKEILLRDNRFFVEGCKKYGLPYASIKEDYLKETALAGFMAKA